MLAAPAPEDAATTLPEESIVMFDAVKLPTAGLIILGINYLSLKINQPSLHMKHEKQSFAAPAVTAIMSVSSK